MWTWTSSNNLKALNVKKKKKKKKTPLRFPGEGILPQDCCIKIMPQFPTCLFALWIC